MFFCFLDAHLARDGAVEGEGEREGGEEQEGGDEIGTV